MPKKLLKALKKNLKEKNYYSALLLALTLPDICANIEYPQMRPSKKYIKWFDKFLASAYQKEGKQMLSGSDCYALRCSILHEGQTAITHQGLRKKLDDFKFIACPNPNFKMHLNYYPESNKLNIQVEVFCQDVMEAVDTWLNARSNKENTITEIDITVITEEFIQRLTKKG